MNNETVPTDAAQQYAAAHDAHYTSKDLPKALDLYMVITATHPESPEAGYSRSQLQNIVKSVVPETDLQTAQVELARTHLQQAGSLEEPTEQSAPGEAAVGNA